MVLDSTREYLSEHKVIAEKDAVEKATIFLDDYICNGYGTHSQGIDTTIRNVMIRYGIPLDATYTSKAFWGMREYIEKEAISNKNILFIHTGGTPWFLTIWENGRKVA